MPTTLSSNDVGYWYLRLNGFLQLENFLVHGEVGDGSRTDIDLLGARFPYRSEHLADPMEDDAWIDQEAKTTVVFGECKTSARDFNDSWANKDRKVMESMLSLVGAVASERIPAVAIDMYREGRCTTEPGLLITTLLLHHDPQEQVVLRWPNAVRVQIADALRFVHARFRRYEPIKTDHGGWNPAGRHLWDVYLQTKYCADDFCNSVLGEIGATARA